MFVICCHPQGMSLTDERYRGIIPRTVAAIFEGVASADPSLEFTIKVMPACVCGTESYVCGE
jgi:hypothetical protein